MSTPLQLKGSTALITGGAGFVGSHIVDALVQEGAKVRVVDNFVRGGEANLTWARANGSVELISGDIRDAKLWDKALSNVDVVFHQAALRVNRCEENPQECWEVMVQATYDLLKACASHGIKKVIAASSAIVYGKADTLPTPETHHLNYNTTWYGAAKIMNEQLLNVMCAQGKFASIVLRYFNIYGSRTATKGHTEVLVKWFQALDAGQSIRIFGDGSQTMDWIDVRDVARANVMAAASSAGQGVFNVGSGVETSLYDLAKLVMRLWGQKGEPELVTSQAPSNPIPRRWADVRAAKQAFGFQSQETLETGISEMLKWWKEKVPA